jgi:hypothetical protein
MTTQTKSKKPAKGPTAEEVRILKEVQHLFSILAVAPTPLTIPGGKGGRYELYTYFFVAERLKRESGNLQVINPAPGLKFLFKGRPSHASNDYSYCTFTNKAGDSFELRNGVEYQGHNMKHEVDIAVSTPLDHKQVPTEEELRFAVECKYFAEQNGFKGQFRSQVGAIVDLTRGHHAGTGCLVFGTRFRAYFASHHPFSTKSEFTQYLLSYRITPLFDFQPRGKSLPMARRWVRDCYTSL